MEKIFTLTGRREVAEGTTELTLTPKTPDDRFDFTPGQYVEIWLIHPPYSDERGSHREFSINSTPDEKTVWITFRNSESAAKRGFLEAPIGSEFHLTGPHGYFTLPNDAEVPVVLVAGGVGITPFLSMIRTNVTAGKPRRITLVAANAKPERAPHRQEMERLAAEYTWFSYHPAYGQLTPEALQDAKKDLANPRFYVAGPPGMVAATFEMLTKLGISREHIQLEEFSGY
jgi:ferredoxin-NADP reductase